MPGRDTTTHRGDRYCGMSLPILPLFPGSVLASKRLNSYTHTQSKKSFNIPLSCIYLPDSTGTGISNHLSSLRAILVAVYPEHSDTIIIYKSTQCACYMDRARSPEHGHEGRVIHWVDKHMAHQLRLGRVDPQDESITGAQAHLQCIESTPA